MTAQVQPTLTVSLEQIAGRPCGCTCCRGVLYPNPASRTPKWFCSGCACRLWLTFDPSAPAPKG